MAVCLRKFAIACAMAIVVGGCADDADGRSSIRGLGDDDAIRLLDRDLDLREGTINLPFAGEVEILYAVIDGRAFWSGDISLGSADDLEDRGFRAASLASGLWPDGTVKYMIDGSLPDSFKGGLASAMGEWTDRAGVRFVEIGAQDQNGGGYLTVKGDEDGCWADMGYRAGDTMRLNLGTGCDQPMVFRHELGHVLGLFHEQSRADRDEHVTIHWDNIEDNNAYNYDQYTKGGTPGKDRGAYDYDSVMHYESYAFAKDPNKPAMTKKDGGLITRTADHDISAGDALAVAAMYAEQPAGDGGAADDPQGGAAGSCSGHCGSTQGVATADGSECFCDAGCTDYGDCCADKDAVCGAGNDAGNADGGAANQGATCTGKCGSADPQSDGNGGNCYCDDLCTGNADCCTDYAAQCGGGDQGGQQDQGGGAQGSCVGYCGGPGSQGESCYCDQQCTSSGDCCSDYAAACGGGNGGNGGGGAAGSCAGLCGSTEPSGSCYCDPGCFEYGDCCPDYGQHC